MRRVVSEVVQNVRKAHLAIEVITGMAIVNALDPEAVSVHPADSVIDKIAKTIPSIFVAPDISRDTIGHESKTADTIAETTLAGLAIEASRRTSGTKDTLLTSGAAFITTTTTDEISQKFMTLNPSEKRTPDVGASGIIEALFSRTLTQKMLKAKTTARKWTWASANVLFASAATLGVYALEQKNARLDLPIHISAVGTGVAAGIISERLRRLTNNAAAPDLKT